MATLSIEGPTWRRIARDGSVILIGSIIVLLAVEALSTPGWFIDAHAYWAASLADPYHISTVGQADAYLYSPAFIQAIAPLHLFPASVFTALVLLVGLASLWALCGRWAGLLLFLFPPVFFELADGNINIALALAVVAGFRWPGLWSAVLLTKVTPGIGLLWFAVRREWRPLGIAVAVTAAIAAASFALAPGLWVDWAGVLLSNGQDGAGVNLLGPIWLRLPAAALLVAWGALTDRRWTVVAGATLATPALSWVSISMLVGVVPLLRRGNRGTGRDGANGG